MLSLLYLVVKTQQYFVTLSCMFLGEKTVLEIWLNNNNNNNCLFTNPNRKSEKEIKEVIPF